MQTPFKVVSDSFGGVDYFAFHGNIDAHAEKELAAIPSRVTSRVVKLDFGKAGRINSMGLALLLRCLRAIKEERLAEVRLLELNPTNIMLFKMTGVFLLASAEK